MKSNQEQRSNECLPPKKRELAAASTLASEEQRPAMAVMAPATDSQRTENLAWLASVAGGPEGGGTTRHRGSSGGGGGGESEGGGGARYKPLQCSMASDSFSSSSSLRLVTSLPAVYTSPVVSQSAVVGGAIHYTQLPPNLQFIASPYPAPYAGYISSISSQLLPPPPPPLSSSSSSSSYLPLQRPSSHAAEMAFASPPPPPPSSPSSQTSKFDQQRASLQARVSMPPPPTDAAPPHHHHHHAPSPRTVLSPHHHHHQGALHPHHHTATLGQGMSHVVLQYADGPPSRKEEGPRPPRDQPLNGEVERGGGRRCFESGLLSSKAGSKQRDGLSVCSSSSAYEGGRLMAPPPPSDYATHDPSGLRTSSVMLMPNSHVGDNKRPSPSSAPTHLEKGGIVMGKPVSRTLSSSSSSSSSSSAASSSSSPFAFPSPLSVVDGLKAAVATVSPHTVIHTTHSATEPFSVGFPSGSIYPQPSLIGYLAGGQQQPIGYQTGLPQHHLLIPGAQPVIIPVSAGGGSVATALESSSSSHHHHVTVSSAQCSPFPTTLPQHAYITTKGEATPEGSGVPYHHHHLLHHHHHAPSSGAVIQAQLHLPLVAAASAQAPPPSPGTTTPSMPPYFIKGSIIQLADGELKRVEELKTEDFIQSAEVSSELKIDSSTVERIDGSHSSPNFAVVQFSVGEHRAQVCVEVLVEYPFFVFGQGWSSCCPDRTTQLLELPCTKLSVGDVCISLTLKNLKNGSLKKTQTFELVTPASAAAAASGGHHGFLKPPRAAPDASASRTHSGGGNSSRHGERANGVGQRGSATSGGGVENGELGFEEERGSVSRGQQGAAAASNAEEASARKPAAATSRKRRWSAPEGRKVEKTEEEPPLVLPKPSFILHQMKVSIEGRSNIGK